MLFVWSKVEKLQEKDETTCFLPGLLVSSIPLPLTRIAFIIVVRLIVPIILGWYIVLAVIGFLVGEQVEGSSFLFDAQISGPAISHLAQVPPAFWVFLTIAIGTVEQYRATVGWVEPDQAPIDQPGLLRADYIPGDIGFDPLGLKPDDDDDFRTMQTKELQNGRLAMLAAAGFMAQELVDGKGILDHFTS